jgi:GNAT superfamily N-acetyltransferase
MNGLTLKYNELNAEEFIDLWESVWNNAPSVEQTKLALDNTVFRISVFDNDRIVAMARMIGDLGPNYYIKDVIVRPEYQHKGIGRLMINELLKYIDENGIKDTDIFVELCAMPDKIPFYEKFGFSANEAQRLKLMYHVKQNEI